jgi:hypothetical protein
VILTIGSFSFELNEVWFVPHYRMRLGQTGGYLYDDVSWTIFDVIFGTSQANLTSKIQAREVALRNITGDVTFYESDGTTQTAHKIIRANTIEGIKAQQAVYPGGLSSHGGRIFGSGAEYADAGKNFRYLVTTITARQLAVEHEIAFYQQSYRFNLGGTQFAVQGAFQGLPSRFNIMQTVPCWAVQQGRIIGATGYPAAPVALAGSLSLDPERSWLEYETPQMIGTLNTLLYPLAFHYEFRAAFPMPDSPPATP